MSTSDLPNGWENRILEGIGATPGTKNVGNLGAWNTEEGGADVADTAHYNPFNTTLPWGGSTAINEAGVQSYRNLTDGMNATIATLLQENMAGIRKSLVEDQPFHTFATAVNDSPWGTHFTVNAPEPTPEPTEPTVTPIPPDSPGKLNAPVVGIARTSTGKGYWMAAKDGGVFNYGDAEFFGSIPGLTPKITLVGEIVGIYGTVTDKGYLLVGSDGGTFAFGDAQGYGNPEAS